MNSRKAFTLIELLVVISIIALLVSILMPALNLAREQATKAVCLANQKNLITAWVMYADDNEDQLIVNGACYDTLTDTTSVYYGNPPWVFRPKDENGNNFPIGPPPTLTDQDRFRGIRLGTMWNYVKNLDVYHCPGDTRKRRREPPRDCFRSYSISYAFGYKGRDDPFYEPYQKMSDIKTAGNYYVFVEEEHNGSRYSENEGGWHLPFNNNRNVKIPGGFDPTTYTMYDPLASYHNEASTFGFADGHADSHKWIEPATLEFIDYYKNKPNVESGHYWTDEYNEDIKWLLQHFIGRERLE
jgi:prepilin-type N-terminal cleavage/methylation domain-containing protein/prepilin-type processing-associated H-X9-DG protein